MIIKMGKKNPMFMCNNVVNSVPFTPKTLYTIISGYSSAILNIITHGINNTAFMREGTLTSHLAVFPFEMTADFVAESTKI
jgi:hypothetical protein